jgi:hypothetical protein
MESSKNDRDADKPSRDKGWSLEHFRTAKSDRALITGNRKAIERGHQFFPRFIPNTGCHILRPGCSRASLSATPSCPANNFLMSN